MSYFKTARCKSCNAKIIWALTARHKWMPVDAAMVESGTRFQLHEQPEGAPMATEVSYGAGRNAHFATCPNAKEHRKPSEQRKLFE